MVTVGQRILKFIKKPDIVARMGGDEYAVLINKSANKKEITTLVENIHTSLQEAMNIVGNECYVNYSIGIAIYPDNGIDSETLLRNADSKMYEVKRKGKGGFSFN